MKLALTNDRDGRHGWKRGCLMLLGVTVVLALAAPAVATASPPLPPPPGNTPHIADAAPLSGSNGALVVTVAFKGGYSTPASTPDQTTSSIADRIRRDVNPWFAEVSHGQFSGYFPVRRAVTVQPQAQLCSPEWINDVSTMADAKLRKQHVEPSGYDAVIYYFRHLTTEQGCNFRGAADYPENGHRVFLNGTIAVDTLVHELGHNLGLGHAGSQFCTNVPLNAPPSERCTQQEFGDASSAMGDWTGGGYSSAQLAQLGWNDGRVTTISAGDPTVHKFLTPLENNVIGSTQAIRLVDGPTTLWLEYRQPIGVDAAAFQTAGLRGGLLVRAEQPSLAVPPARHVAPFLLDMTPLDGDDRRAPFSPGASQEMTVGQAWSNPLGTMTITLNAAGPDGASVTIQSVPGPVPDPPPGPGPGPGPGTVVVPNVRGQTLSVAERDITAAGLVRGTIGSTIDCDDIDRVVSQSPAAGIQVPPGGTVDLEMGIPHPRGCGTPE